MTTKTLDATRALVRGFCQLYPGEAAGFLNDLSPEEILQLLRSEPVPTAAELFLHLNPDVAATLIKRMEDDFFRELFATLDPARAAILLSRVDDGTIERRLAALPPNLAKEVGELMSYSPDSAGYLMDPRVVTFRLEDTVDQALKRLRTIRNRRIIDICLVDEDGQLIGMVPLQDLVVAEPSQQLGALLKGDPISVHAMAPREDVVQLLEKYKLASLPVVDLEYKLLGIIRYQTLVEAAQQDASEDVQAMFGAGRDERALSKVSFAIRKRLPWLEINLATAFLAAAVVGMFEDTIARITALAVFLPVVAGQSGNTGSQALAVTMRGLALREIRLRHWFPVARKEVFVGFINGCVVALSTALVAYIWMNSLGLSIVIGTAMVFSMVIAGLSGAVIPIMLKTVGQDPAQSSSIILTTVTDVVGFLSFLGLATWLAEALHIA